MQPSSKTSFTSLPGTSPWPDSLWCKPVILDTQGALEHEFKAGLTNTMSLTKLTKLT